MTSSSFSDKKAVVNLNKLTSLIKDSDHHLKKLIQLNNRFEDFSIKMDSFLFDYSKQRVTPEIKTELIFLAKQTNAKKKFSEMVNAEIVNTTENRAALHTALRDVTDTPLLHGDIDVKKEINTVNEKIESFVDKIHDKTLKGSTGKAFTDAVVIGIGGSYLGCDFVYSALQHYQDPQIKLHFLPNVDIDNFGQVIKSINPETCLWIVISKSYTTTETMANLNQALLFLDDHNLDPAKHLVTITSKGSPGDDSSNLVLDSFHMFDFIGGRYSVSSAVGGLPLSLAFGYPVFKRFLSGCFQMDQHALNSDENENIPLMAALISIWNTNFLKYSAQAIIPYSSALSKLAPHIQQLNMESLGKSVTSTGKKIEYKTGAIIFGEPGTNAQHSFFQLAHQGTSFPIDFIGVIKPIYNKEVSLSKGVYNHQELWANLIAQAQALAVGQSHKDLARCFSGNRPSSIISINDISPESVGMLLSFYEARTVFEGFILGINPFDQFGVELGKRLATNIREQIRLKNENRDHDFAGMDPVGSFYLNKLFKGSL